MIKRPVSKKPVTNKSIGQNVIPEPTEDHLQIALRLIKLRWDDLDFSDKAEERGSHGVFFTAPQLHALANLAAERMKEHEQARKKESRK